MTRAGSSSRRSAFTLIEILIVVSIVSILASLILVGIQRGRVETMKAIARIRVAGIHEAIGLYLQDEAELPALGAASSPGENQFPALYRALLGAQRPIGPGGRSAPYLSIKEEDIAVHDEEEGALRRARGDEILDDRIDKYLLDPFGEAYIYRVRRDGAGRPPRPEILSLGPNRIEDADRDGECDDIGNW